MTDEEIQEGFAALRWFQKNGNKFIEAMLWPKNKSEVEK